MIRLFYTLALYLLLPLLLLYFFWRSRKDPAYRQRLPERFAFGLRQLPLQAGGIVVHAVSVGEVIAATPLIQQLRQAYPNTPITVTCTTPTGTATIYSRFADSVQHCYLPLDYPGAVQRFLAALQPKLLVIVETELWPNLFRHCQQQAIPVLLVNARLSARSARGYRRFSWLTRPLLNQISCLLTQDNASARRFKALGFNGRLSVMGNLKFELAIPDSQHTLLQRFAPAVAGRVLWVAGSTHAGEDEQLLALYPQLKQQFPTLMLFIVPRHPERFDAVAKMVTAAGLSLWRRSSDSLPDSSIDIALGDSMGELLAWYQLADLVFIGGSLIPRGGHNPLEAISFAKAVQTGPHIFNFNDAYRQLQQHQAVSLVADSAELLANTRQLLADAPLRQAQGQRAQAFFLQQQGATAQSLAVIQAIWGARMQYKTKQQGANHFWYDEDFFSDISAEQFQHQWWQAQQAIVGSSSGRNTAYFVQHGQHKLVLRHYYRGGLIAKLSRDKFLLQAVAKSRAMQEFQLLSWMRSQGLAVPKPVAARYQRCGVFYKADLLIALIPDSKDLASILQQQQLTAQQWQAVGEAIAKMHRLGVYHSDLNCRNIMLDSAGKVWLLDFDKCSRREPGSWQQHNLARLQRSLLKEQRQLAVFCWQPEHWAALLQGYQTV